MEHLLFRMAYWLRRLPSRQFVIIALVIVVIAAVLYGFESAGLWPDWLTADRIGRRGSAV
ncbi:hypothetical protein RDV64_23225 (plasmid) [Acuticoccus sp. MNP-M23]|uniref:hypothetical protein n=1 Tax=Acuticoccus sp. MNP-M23 TaxID=3072793 RepID=UPI0028152F49|nr:hypothetical protein [Acuticoccus sp. MNP-M23]WMS45247.1 hypothetical protein RDV64_23225 [Acuticoccus sp. MNP-M23]